MKKRFIRLVIVLLGLGLLFQAASAAENETKDYSNEPWERAALYLGAFIVDTNSDLELGLGGGAFSVKVDAEELLGLEKNFTVFRADGFWRITRRNRVDFTFYQLKRDGDTFLGVNIPGFGPIGSRVKTDFDMSILRGSYAWSFFKNEHFDLGISAGLYGMDVDFKIQNESPGGGRIEETDFTVPLPVIGLRGNFALTPKWFIRQSFDYFYVNFGDYEGQLVQFTAAVEWNAMKHFGLGLGYNYVQMGLDYDGSDNFLSEIDLAYGGFLLFAKLYF